MDTSSASSSFSFSDVGTLSDHFAAPTELLTFNVFMAETVLFRVVSDLFFPNPARAVFFRILMANLAIAGPDFSL